MRNNNTCSRMMFLRIICVLVMITVAFSIAMGLMYQNLSEQIYRSSGDTKTVDDRKDHFEESNTTSLRLSDISSQLESQATQLDSLEVKSESQAVQLETLRSIVVSEFQEYLNITVLQLEDNAEKVKEVNENVFAQGSLMTYQFSGTFAILGSLISIVHMAAHLRRFEEPFVQRKVLAILCMCPIYSVTSWFSLVFVNAEQYLVVLRDFYEAYCIYTFLSFLIAVLGRGSRDTVIALLAKQDKLKPPIKFNPFASRINYHSNEAKAAAVLHQCQLFSMQFVFLRPVTSIAMLIFDSIYESRWNLRHPQLYIQLIVNLSVFFAFTGLIKFYHAVHDELSWCNPFSKFLCVKGVVFMTFWQGLGISIFAHAFHSESHSDDDNYNARRWSVHAQNTLICLEMFCFAAVHIFVFSVDEWEEGYREKRNQREKTKFSDKFAMNDFVHDVKLVLRRKKEIEKGGNKTDGEIPSSKDLESLTLKEEKDNEWEDTWDRIEKCVEEMDDNQKSDDSNGRECEKENQPNKQLESTSFLPSSCSDLV